MGAPSFMPHKYSVSLWERPKTSATSSMERHAVGVFALPHRLTGNLTQTQLSTSGCLPLTKPEVSVKLDRRRFNCWRLEDFS